MVKEGINGVFGKPPKPPRNKLGKTSDRLEEDAHAMETRLLHLRVKMLEEKKKREAELPLKHAGNRWRSAREDRGSVRQYARDVTKKKTRKQSKNELSKGGETSSGTNKAKTNTSSSRSKLEILSSATVQQWTVSQVLEWLTAIGLEEFQSGFEFHQVTGEMLLSLSPEGYEQLGVFKLSARNRLLAEMEQIRAQVKNQSDTEAAEIIDSKLRDAQLGPEMSPLSKEDALKTHWSHVTPLLENAIASGDGQVPVNLADGDFDEGASHASFMKALLEWRETDLSIQSNQAEGLEWVNPIHTGGDEGEKTGGVLLEGTYSEEEAHNLFHEAVMAWRQGGDTAGTRAVEQTESGCMPSERKSCWQCYRVVQVEDLVHDDQTDKSFCDSTCLGAYREQYARFYTSPL